MILWCDGSHDPAENMRRDTALLEAAAGGAGAVLRLFTFAPPGITLGRAQDPARELDLDRCRAAGVPWAVRPTGGRAIYHDEEWTYSLAAPLSDPGWGGGLEAAYGKVSRLLVASLVHLGVPATLARGMERGDLAPRSALGAAAPCFASTARHEIVIEGRKVVGSAQRRTARALLQQGSVLLGSAHLRLAEVLALTNRERARVRAGLEHASVHAGRWLGARPPLDRWAEALLIELPRGTRRVDGEGGLAVSGVGPPLRLLRG
jgi:lipoyl(octanoyl) transferase